MTIEISSWQDYCTNKSRCVTHIFGGTMETRLPITFPAAARWSLVLGFCFKTGKVKSGMRIKNSSRVLV